MIIIILERIGAQERIVTIMMRIVAMESKKSISDKRRETSETRTLGSPSPLT